MSIAFGDVHLPDYVRCEKCDQKKRPIMSQRAFYVNEWIDDKRPPIRHVYCHKHYAEWAESVDGWQLPIVPCSNTGVKRNDLPCGHDCQSPLDCSENGCWHAGYHGEPI